MRDDLEKPEREIDSMNTSVSEMQDEIEGRLSRAITFLTNSRGDMSAHLSKISSRLPSLQIRDVEPKHVETGATNLLEI
jgi:hypothetical protein